MATSRLSELLLMVMALDISVMYRIALLGSGLHQPRLEPRQFPAPRPRDARLILDAAPPADLAEVTERLRTMGCLEFDSAAPSAKADFIDKVNVRAKKRGSQCC